MPRSARIDFPELLPKDYEAFDERILGSGEFVQQLLKTEFILSGQKVPLEELISEIARCFSIAPSALRSTSKSREFADARGALCYIAARKLGISGAEIARALNITRSGVVVAARRGEWILEQMPDLQSLCKGS